MRKQAADDREGQKALVCQVCPEDSNSEYDNAELVGILPLHFAEDYAIAIDMTDEQ